MKTVMVTGANIGLGKEASRMIAELEGVEKVYLACRSEAKATAAKEDLVKTTGKDIFEVVVVDVSDLDSVRKAVETVDAMDGLIMNAGGALPVDTMTKDGVTTSFAANVLGHVLLTEELMKAGKLSGSVLYVSTELVRGIPDMGMVGLKMPNPTVEDFKALADGSWIKKTESKDQKMDSYGLVKYVGTLWMSAMARKHPKVRFVSVSPGATGGTNFAADLPMAMQVFVKMIMTIMPLFGKAHGLSVGAKRYIDVLVDDGEKYKTGHFYASAKGASGPMGDQAELFLSDLSDEKIQDNANAAIHSFL